jgi:hypothetical protein
MWCKAVRALLPVAAACLFILSSAIPVRAGGFGILVELPSAAWGKARTDGTVLIARAEGCHGPGAMIAAKAEGLVNGKRVSIPLRLDTVGVEAYGLKRQWPKEGVWVVSITAKSAREIVTGTNRFRPVTTVLVEFAANGNARNVKPVTVPGSSEVRRIVLADFVSGTEKPKAIDAALRRLVASAR